MPEERTERLVMPDLLADLTPAQQNAVRLLVAEGRAEQIKEDEDILSEAKKLKQDAARLRFAFILRRNCKADYFRVSKYMP